jgi:hypothetical protein
MTEEERARHTAHRQVRAKAIMTEPHFYKACDQCRSIMAWNAKLCGVCGAHRFVKDPKIVRATVEEALESPFPFTSGTVPRI